MAIYSVDAREKKLSRLWILKAVLRTGTDLRWRDGYLLISRSRGADLTMVRPV